MRCNSFVACLALLVCVTAGCVGRDVRSAGWDGRIDTLPDGRVAVENGSRGLWGPSPVWAVIEDLRIGAVDVEGPESFGRVTSLAVDPTARIWVLDAQASELRVFGPDGAYVRTVGRSGGGPGEFAQPVRIDISPEGNLWVMDPENNRLSVFDSAGSYLEGKRVLGGFIIMPWPGGFDQTGSYYAPVVSYEPDFHIALGRFDNMLGPLDTLQLPTDPVKRDRFTIESGGLTRVAAGVPFQGRLVWRLSDRGTIWALITDQYRMLELSAEGDTLRSITKAHSLVPVTSQERADALKELKWFTDQGGRIDPSKIPDHKPPVGSFFLDEDGNVWVTRAESEPNGAQPYDIFNAEGQYLGVLEVPVALQSFPVPFVRDGMLYGVTRDSMDVQYVVRAKVVRPTEG